MLKEVIKENTDCISKIQLMQREYELYQQKSYLSLKEKIRIKQLKSILEESLN